MRKNLLFSLILILFLSNKSDDCGKYRWFVKTLTDSQGEVLITKTAQISSIHELVTEQRNAPHFERNPSLRYSDENKVVRVDAILLEIKAEGDNDFHIVLKSPNSDETIVGELPNGDCSTFDNHINLRMLFNNLRRQIISEIGFQPTHKIKYVNRKVTVEGIPFWDELSNAHKPTGSAPNQREIHPIRLMEFK